jgi:hypothetical protein
MRWICITEEAYAPVVGLVQLLAPVKNDSTTGGPQADLRLYGGGRLLAYTSSALP